MHPAELARQLTLIDQDYFRKIPITELMNSGFTAGEDSDAHFAKVNSWFNTVTYWIAFEVLAESSLKKRVKVICHFIVVAQVYQWFIANLLEVKEPPKL